MGFIIEIVLNSTHSSQCMNPLDGLPIQALEPRLSFAKTVSMLHKREIESSETIQIHPIIAPQTIK